jgi:hypothetical protein
MRLLPFAAVIGLFAATPALAQPPAVSFLNEPAPPVVSSTSSPVDRITEACDALPGSRFWANADYLLWWGKKAETPALIQTVPTALAVSGGTLPAGSATTFFPPDEKLDFGSFNGIRLTAGYNFGPNWGIDISGFLLETKTINSAIFGDGSPVSQGIARSYLQAGTGTPISLFFNLPGEYAGGVTAAADSQFYGGDINVRYDWYRLFCDRCDLLAGFRYSGLEEGVAINGVALFPDNTLFTVSDSFRTRNNYYGAQVGTHTQWYFGKLSTDLILKGGIGGVHQQVTATGSNSFTTTAGTDTEQGGLYARGANTGEFTRDKFAFAGEIGANLGYAITPNVRLRIGYTINYLSSVARAGSMIDPLLNEQNIRFVAQPAASTAVAPTFNWNRASEFWVQGINFGITVGY